MWFRGFTVNLVMIGLMIPFAVMMERADDYTPWLIALIAFFGLAGVIGAGPIYMENDDESIATARIRVAVAGVVIFVGTIGYLLFTHQRIL